MKVLEMVDIESYSPILSSWTILEKNLKSRSRFSNKKSICNVLLIVHTYFFDLSETQWVQVKLIIGGEILVQ